MYLQCTDFLVSVARQSAFKACFGYAIWSGIQRSGRFGMGEDEKEGELLGCATFAQLKLPPDSDLVAVKKAGAAFLEDASEESDYDQPG